MEAFGPVGKALSRTTLTLKTFHCGGRFCDVRLKVGTKIFKSQRSFLAAASEYFDTMFASNFKESSAISNDEPVTLHELDASAFEEILHFMYSGKVHVTESNVYLLLFMSDFLRLRASDIVEEECIKYLRNYNSPIRVHTPLSNVFDLYSFSYVKEKKELIDISRTHICQHLHYYSNDVQFMELPFECFNALLEWSKGYIYLSLHGIGDVLLKIVLDWINYSRNERRKYRSELMKNINLSNISNNSALLVINQLENIVGDSRRSLRSYESKLEKLEQKLETEMSVGMSGENNFQFHQTITFLVKDLRNLSIKTSVTSPATVISSLPWRILILRTSEKHLGLYLQCDGTPDEGSSWACCARCKLIIISHKGTEKNLSREYKCHTFSSSSVDWGYQEFALWNDIFMPEKGFLKDNAVTFEAHVEADVPCVSNSK